MKTNKEFLFSITKKDFKIDTYKSTGAGGQHRNKTDSAVRITHIESGAIGKCETERSQHRNKKIAFERLAKSDKFKQWLKIKSSEVIGGETVEQKVDRMLHLSNLKIECKNEKNKWSECSFKERKK